MEKKNRKENSEEDSNWEKQFVLMIYDTRESRRANFLISPASKGGKDVYRACYKMQTGRDADSCGEDVVLPEKVIGFNDLNQLKTALKLKAIDELREVLELRYKVVFLWQSKVEVNSPKELSILLSELRKLGGLRYLLLCIGGSADLGDKLTENDGMQVLCWMNEFTKRHQVDFAFFFGYKMIEELLQKSSVESFGAMEAAYQIAIDFCERQMDGGFHTFSYGIENDGEPCLFPKFPSRPNAKWTYPMYENKLCTVAHCCAGAISKVLDSISKRVKNEIVSNSDADIWNGNQKDWLEDMYYYIGSYFGWLYLLRYSKDHSHLTWKKKIYDVEHAFSGENFPLDKLEERFDEERKNGIVGLKPFDYEGLGMKNSGKWVLVLYKLEQYEIGYKMLGNDGQSVIPRHEFKKVVSDPLFRQCEGQDKLELRTHDFIQRLCGSEEMHNDKDERYDAWSKLHGYFLDWACAVRILRNIHHYGGERPIELREKVNRWIGEFQGIRLVWVFNAFQTLHQEFLGDQHNSSDSPLALEVLQRERRQESGLSEQDRQQLSSKQLSSKESAYTFFWKLVVSTVCAYSVAYRVLREVR